MMSWIQHQHYKAKKNSSKIWMKVKVKVKDNEGQLKRTYQRVGEKR